MALATLYLGNPLSPFGMQALTAPPPGADVPGGSLTTAGGATGVSATVSRGTVSQSLISGGLSVQRKPKIKSSYQIGWSLLGSSDIDLLQSFFDGRQGGGPYCLVDPSWSNFLPPNVASMGAVLGALPEWTVTAGTLAPVSAAVPVAGMLTGVASWSGASVGSVLYTGLNNIVDGTWLPPIIPGVAHRWGIWMRLASGTATLTTSFLDGAGGAAPSTLVGGGTTLSGTWQELSIGAAASTSWGSTADYAMAKWAVTAASSPVIQIAAASFVYDNAANANALSPWVSGVGVPRVVITGDAPVPVDLIGGSGQAGQASTWREYTLTLQEM